MFDFVFKSFLLPNIEHYREGKQSPPRLVDVLQQEI